VRHRKAKALQTIFANLCAELKDVAVPLVDAFDVPDYALGPMGRAGACRCTSCVAALSLPSI